MGVLGARLLPYHTYMVSNIALNSHGTGCGETRRAAQWNSVLLLVPPTGATPALTITHHRSSLLEHCIASSERIGADAASIRYVGSEPYGFGPGASSAPGVTDVGTLLAVHYAGASAVNASGGLKAREIPGFGVLATLLIPLMAAADVAVTSRSKRQRL
jgi:hypothetical protein